MPADGRPTVTLGLYRVCFSPGNAFEPTKHIPSWTELIKEHACVCYMSLARMVTPLLTWKVKKYYIFSRIAVMLRLYWACFSPCKAFEPTKHIPSWAELIKEHACVCFMSLASTVTPLLTWIGKTVGFFSKTALYIMFYGFTGAVSRYVTHAKKKSTDHVVRN